MDNVQNCDSYIIMKFSQTFWCFLTFKHLPQQKIQHFSGHILREALVNNG
jgi:hypothetical protein